MSYQENLAKFRQAGKENDVNYQYYMGLLLGHLSSMELIGLGTKYLLEFLPRFEKYYLDVDWPRRILESISNGRNLEQSVIDDMYSEFWDRSFNAGGSQYFIDAVERLGYAFRHRDKSDAVINGVRMALEATIFGMNFEQWATDHPEDYKLFCDVDLYPEKYSIEKQRQINRRYRRNPDAKAHETRLVLSIADDIEAIPSRRL